MKRGFEMNGITEAQARELDDAYPGGWDIAYTRADADKLYVGGIPAVRPVGEVWSDDQD